MIARRWARLLARRALLPVVMLIALILVDVFLVSGYDLNGPYIFYWWFISPFRYSDAIFAIGVVAVFVTLLIPKIPVYVRILIVVVGLILAFGISFVVGFRSIRLFQTTEYIDSTVLQGHVYRLSYISEVSDEGPGELHLHECSSPGLLCHEVDAFPAYYGDPSDLRLGISPDQAKLYVVTGPDHVIVREYGTRSGGQANASGP